MLKRAFDIATSATALVVTAPICLALIFGVAVEHKSWPIYTQIRIGQDRQPFRIYKIKTMSDKVDENSVLLPDDLRTSKFGRILRKTKLDEIPQFFNVLRGDMSIVGPRPAAIFRGIANDYLRHTVKPGLTGISQISDKNRLSEIQIKRLDHGYVRKQSFKEDLRIILNTPLAIIRQRKSPHYHKEAQSSLDTRKLSY